VDINVLEDIKRVLKAFHIAQELLSSERTPTLSLVLPTYEQLHELLRGYLTKNTFPHLNHAIHAASNKIAKYVRIARQNECYGIAMFLNPVSKKSWMEKYWDASDVEHCMEKLRAAMMAYLKHNRVNNAPDPIRSYSHPPSTAPNARASRNLGFGFDGIGGMLAELNGIADSSQLETGQLPRVLTEHEQDEADRHMVEAEIHNYIAAPVYPGLDIMGWWNVHRNTYRLLWKVARDVLPAQATSVPCERVFSSSKQTCTSLRNSLQPHLVEKLQIVKFGLREDRLDFDNGWLVREEEMIGGTDDLNALI
jgi:hypothetical protein